MIGVLPFFTLPGALTWLAAVVLLISGMVSLLAYRLSRQRMQLIAAIASFVAASIFLSTAMLR